MSSDNEIAQEVRAAVAQLNATLRKAFDAGLVVELTSADLQEIGKYGRMPLYSASIERRTRID